MGIIELVLHVTYEREKANELLDMGQKDIGHIIRRDFDLLKLPHPPQENIRKPKLNGITVSWMTREHTVCTHLPSLMCSAFLHKPATLQDSDRNC
jgi:hypothetical protein